MEHDNPVSRVFWGRCRIEAAAACFYFGKGGRLQQLIHHFKYRGRRDIGEFLGREYGNDLAGSPLFRDIDMVVPVPLHPRRLRQRGFNQSAVLAAVMAGPLHVHCDDKALVRTKASATQTRKSRWARWENVSEIFSVPDQDTIRGKHILLVDDVITTGATLEACANALLAVEGVRVSVATLAFTGQ
ncbi:MAG: ComF family protein [Bacteroidales bacterium]|nr:ComF family protein [Bacteroidales bacterium]